MDRIKDLTVDDLEHLIEQKVMELLGDPDSGFNLRQEFKDELDRRLKAAGTRVSSQEVEKRFA